MSFTEWVDESRRRFQTEKTATATVGSLREFVNGARNRVRWALASWDGGSEYTTALAGERVDYVVESEKEMRRARSAINEAGGLEWLMAPVDSTTVFWDIGAYHGTYSVVAAVKGATTVAFEPHAENMAKLSQNAELNNVTIDKHGVALSDESGTRSFGKANAPGSELSIQEDGETTVQTSRADEITPKPDVVKLDVEGHECAVLDGMRETLRNVDRILVEVHLGVAADDVRRRLSDAGLSVREVEMPRSQTFLGGVRW